MPDTVNGDRGEQPRSDPLTLAVREPETATWAARRASVQFALTAWTAPSTTGPQARPQPSCRGSCVFDFASQSALDVALQPSDLPDDGGNPHATRLRGLSRPVRDGKHMVASKGASWAGYLVYIEDLSLPKTAANWLTVDGRATGVAAANRVMTASFNPDGTQFVADATWGDTLGATICPSTTGSPACGRVRWLWVPGELSRLVARRPDHCRDPYVREQRHDRPVSGGWHLRSSPIGHFGHGMDLRRGGRGAAHDQQEPLHPNSSLTHPSYCTASRPGRRATRIRWSTATPILRRRSGQSSPKPTPHPCCWPKRTRLASPTS